MMRAAQGSQQAGWREENFIITKTCTLPSGLTFLLCLHCAPILTPKGKKRSHQSRLFPAGSPRHVAKTPAAQGSPQQSKTTYRSLDPFT